MISSGLKKSIMIVVFLILVAGLAFLIYLFFFRSTAPITLVPSEEIPYDSSSENYSLPDSAPGTERPGDINVITEPEYTEPASEIPTQTFFDESRDVTDRITEQLMDTRSFRPVIDRNDSVRYYNPDENKFYSVDRDGEIGRLSDNSFYSVEDVNWSSDRNRAILEYPDGSNILFNFETNKQITLPRHWEDFSFSPSGEQIVFKSMSPDVDNRYLMVANNDGSQVRSIEFIGANADIVIPSWSPNKQSIAMYTKSVDFSRQEVYFVGLNGENFKSTIVDGRGFQYKWSMDGKKLLYSVFSDSSDMKPELWVVEAQGESIGSRRKNLGIQTWADKCTFLNTVSAYCAVPRELASNAGIFPTLAENSNDDIYKIDINTGMKNIISVPEGAGNVSNLEISKDGNTLFFQKGDSERLFKIELQNGI